MQIHDFANTHTLNDYFATHIGQLLSEAISLRGQAFLVVSGGKTPQGLFKTLSRLKLPWRQVTITLTDERWLPPDNDNSNEKMVKATLLKARAIEADFVGLYNNAPTAIIAADTIEKQIRGLPVFDVVILGMGEDGHTASLFPCSAEISEALRSDSAVIATTPANAPYQRLSLTKMRLLNSRHIYLHLVGNSKMIVLKKALTDLDEEAMPIRAFLHHPAHDVRVMYAPE